MTEVWFWGRNFLWCGLAFRWWVTSRRRRGLVAPSANCGGWGWGGMGPYGAAWPVMAAMVTAVAGVLAMATHRPLLRLDWLLWLERLFGVSAATASLIAGVTPV